MRCEGQSERCHDGALPIDCPIAINFETTFGPRLQTPAVQKHVKT